MNTPTALKRRDLALVIILVLVCAAGLANRELPSLPHFLNEESGLSILDWPYLAQE